MQKYANLVELENCCQTADKRIFFLQNFVLIQPRTSPPKICKIFEKCIFEKCIFEKNAARRPGPRKSRGPSPRPRARPRRPDVRERRLAKFRQNVARFRLYRHRFLQENMRFAAFFKIYQILKLKFLKFDKILQILRHLQFFAEISRKLLNFQTDFLRKF